MVPFRLPRMPDLENLAILLDVDGTILDIAPAPEQVTVPAELSETLARLSVLTGGALALVSGRPLSDLDRVFAPLQFPAVGGHGAEFRPVPVANRNFRSAGKLDALLKEKIAAVARAADGVRLEDKGYAVALHYRAAPQHETMVREAVEKICADEPAFEILPGKYVVEVKASGFNKANGVRDLMASPPFSGRRPVFIGDDATDEYVFAIMPELEGFAFSVGDAVRGADGHFNEPADVRAWLARLARSRQPAAR
jgi:trehalose 6-phosphate phosphatase